MQSKAIILFLALVSLSLSALIGSAIYSMSRLFQYRISITVQGKALVAYATLAPTNSDCTSGKCFIGWIDNYTLGNEVVQGYRQDMGTNNTVFLAQLLQTPSLTVTSSKQLDATAKTLIDITASILAPLPFLASNAGPGNGDQTYYFVPLDGQTDGEMSSHGLDPQSYSFRQTAERFSTGSSWAGWASALPASDVMLFDQGLNCLLQREMVFNGGAKIHVEMVSKSIFTDLTAYLQVLSDISANEGIKDENTFTANTIFPSGSVASLLQLIM